MTEGPSLITKIYSVSAVLMSHCKCYGSILDVREYLAIYVSHTNIIIAYFVRIRTKQHT